MVATTAETLVVNGVNLNTLAKNIESLTGRLRAPNSRTANISVPGMHGDLWIPGKKYAANTIVLPMWVQGCDDDGGVPEGSSARREFFKRVDELVGLFKSTGKLLDVRWTKADGQVRQCFAEATDVFDFTTGTEGLARVGVVLTIPGVFWQDINLITKTYTGVLASVTPAEFTGGSAPTEDMVYTFGGPWNNPEAAFSDGSFFRYNAVLAAGQTLTVDSGEWELSATGFTPDYSKLVHDGEDAYWGALPAAPAAAPVVTLNGTSKTTDTSFTMRGRRKYLIG